MHLRTRAGGRRGRGPAARWMTEERGARCPNCGNQMLADSQYVTQEAKGLVQGGMVVSTVTDDLTIFPMSNISSIALLNTVAVRDLGALQEKTVQVGYKEVTTVSQFSHAFSTFYFYFYGTANCSVMHLQGVEILKTSLQSKTVLTDVFLGNKT